jgi:hypothetical protein
MNPKQLACVVLMAFIGMVTYFGQIAHKKVVAMKADATAAGDAAAAAESARQTAEILTTKTRVDTAELRGFLSKWVPHAQRVQTEQDVDSSFEFSLRDRGISLVDSRKSDVKGRRDDKFMPKVVQTTIAIEDEYAKVMNWFGDIEKRLPLSRVTACRITGGSSVRQLKLDVTIETPIVDTAADTKAPAKPEKNKKA